MIMVGRKYDERYRQFLIAVYKRDGRKCQHPDCKRRSSLQVHHISRWVDNPMMRFNPINGIVLCTYHHKKITGSETIYAPLFRTIVLRNQEKKKKKL
jgi:hypothetical protein